VPVLLVTLCSEKNPLILQYISNTPKLIQMKFTTDVTLKLQLKDTRHLIITAEL